MAGQGPQRFPDASTAYWYQDDYPGDLMEVNVVLLHTTEGRSLPDYGGGASAPNLTAVPDFGARRLRWYQHFDIDRSSRALRNLAGGVETNTLNVCQVELVGTCDPSTHTKWGDAQHIYWPQAPDWALAEVAAFLRWMHDQHGVPLSGPELWLPYPQSYGASAARMTNAQWSAFKGVCGHQHAAENDHGDPGAIDFPRLIALAKGAPLKDDMTLTDTDIDRIARRVLTLDGVIPNTDPASANKFHTLAQTVNYTEIVARRTETKVAALTAANTKLAEAVATLAAGIGDLDPAAIIAELKTAIEAIDIRIDTNP